MLFVNVFEIRAYFDRLSCSLNLTYSSAEYYSSHTRHTTLHPLYPNSVTPTHDYQDQREPESISVPKDNNNKHVSIFLNDGATYRSCPSCYDDAKSRAWKVLIGAQINRTWDGTTCQVSGRRSPVPEV